MRSEARIQQDRQAGRIVANYPMGPQNSVPLQARRSLLMNHKEKGFRLWARRFSPSVKIHEPVLIATVRYNRVPDILAFTSYSLQFTITSLFREARLFAAGDPRAAWLNQPQSQKSAAQDTKVLLL